MWDIRLLRRPIDLESVDMNPQIMLSTLREHHTASRKSKRRRLLELEPTSLDDLVQRLKRNEISELNLGFGHSDFLHGKRYGIILEKALKQNTSVTSVAIGWRHSNRESLIVLLRAIASNTSLLHIKLILDDWVPAFVLNDMLRQQQKLVTLELQSVTVLRHDASGQCCCSPKSAFHQKAIQQEKTGNQWPTTARHSWEVNKFCHFVMSGQRHRCDHSVITHCILQQNFNQLPRLKVLSLVDCDLTDDRVVGLADFLHLRGGLAELSLRGNRKLTGRGLKIICQAPVMKRLDLSLCDLESRAGKAIAEGIAARPWPVEELILSGNHRLDNASLLALTSSSCCQKVVSLDLSHCACKHHRSILILNALSLLSETTTLRRLNMHGTFVGNDVFAHALHDLLSSAAPLRSIHLNDSGDPEPMNAQQLGIVLEGIQNSYEIEHLAIAKSQSPKAIQIWRKIEFALRLNVAGRRILRCPRQKPIDYQGFPVAPADDWFQVLEKAGGKGADLNVLFWIVREGADHFG